MMSSNVRTNNKSYLNIEGKHIQLVLKKQQRIIIIILLILLKLNKLFFFLSFFLLTKTVMLKILAVLQCKNWDIILFYKSA